MKLKWKLCNVLQGGFEKYLIDRTENLNCGFFIAEKDMDLRGFGDVLGYKQSGIKDFHFADPVHHEDLFNIAEKNIKEIELNENNFNKYDFLLKFFDKADIINQIKLEKSNLD